jgi:hypothetical protein
MKEEDMPKSYKEPRGSQQLIYIVCPLCGRNRIIQTGAKGRARWDFFDPATSPLIQIRQAQGKLPTDQQPQDQLFRRRGGARAGGFPLQAAFTWEEAQTKDEFSNDVAAMKDQISRLEKFSGK